MRRFQFVTMLIGVIATPLVLASQFLVDADTLSKQLPESKLVLIDMSDETQYQRFHLPGAIHFPYEILVTQTQSISLPIPQSNLVQLLGKIGISNTTPVVIYDDIGGLNAARLYWELEQLGHANVAVLNGGLVQWILEGRHVTNHASSPHSPVTYLPKTTGRANEVGLSDIAVANKNKKTVLLDVRSEDEYRGDPRSARTGHIPGAKWWDWEQSVNFESGFMQQEKEILNDSLAKIGIQDHRQPIITYCRSGHRATQAYFTLKRLGFDNVRVYTGSMLEYEQHKQLPLTKGMMP